MGACAGILGGGSSGCGTGVESATTGGAIGAVAGADSTTGGPASTDARSNVARATGGAAGASVPNKMLRSATRRNMARSSERPATRYGIQDPFTLECAMIEGDE